MSSRTLLVEFAQGGMDNMTPRELCGWARARGARVVTLDGWPMINGVIRALGVEAQQAGRVIAAQDGTCLASWERDNPVELDDPEKQTSKNMEGIEIDWPVRS